MGLGAEQVYGVKLRTFIIYLFIFKIFFFYLDHFQSLYSACYNIASFL